MEDGLPGALGELALLLVDQAKKKEAELALILCHLTEGAAALE